MKASENKFDFELTKDASYLAFSGELWGVSCEDIVSCEDRQRYNGIVVYVYFGDD